MSRSAFSGVFFGIALLFVIASCVVNQVTGSHALVLVPDDVMNDLGVQAYQEVVGQAKESANTQWKVAVGRISQRIAQASEAQFDWKFRLIESNEQNAFCLPGGKIVVYTGILQPAENEATLAFVIG